MGFFFLFLSQKVWNIKLSDHWKVTLNFFSPCRWWMSWGVWLHLSPSPQEFVSNDVIFGSVFGLESIWIHAELVQFMFEAMWCQWEGTGRLTFTQWVQKKWTNSRYYLSVVFQKSPSNYFFFPPSFHHVASYLDLFTLLLPANLHSEIENKDGSYHICPS